MALRSLIVPEQDNMKTIQLVLTREEELEQTFQAVELAMDKTKAKGKQLAMFNQDLVDMLETIKPPPELAAAICLEVELHMDNKEVAAEAEVELELGLLEHLTVPPISKEDQVLAIGLMALAQEPRLAVVPDNNLPQPAGTPDTSHQIEKIDVENP